jgi:hypothetical protein
MQPVRPQLPKQIERASSAIALSMVVAFGVMPKLNLTALAILAFLSLANQFNRKVAIVGFISFLLSGILNPVMQRLGFSSFAFPAVQYLLNALEQFPVLPWFRLNSPAVLGSIWTGVAAFTTLMLASLVMLSTRSREGYATKANSMDLAMMDRNLVTGELKFSTMPTASTPGQMDAAPVSHVSIYSLATDSRITSDIPAENEPQRISSSAQFALENTKENAVALAASEDYSNMEIRESIIEIIRFRSPKDADLRNETSRALETSRNTDPNKVISLPIHNLMQTKTQSNSIIFTEAKPTVDAGRSVASSMNIAERSMENTMNLITSEIELTTPVDAMDSSNLIRHESHSTQQEPISNLSSKPRDEALRYLLWHLSETKDQPVIRERAS